MTRGKRWNTLAVLVHIHLFVALIDVATTFDITRITPIADENIRTGNKILYEEEINESATKLKSSDAAVADVEQNANMKVQRQADILDVNELPVRYDEAQLWRIYNISDNMRRQVTPVAEILEKKYGK